MQTAPESRPLTPEAVEQIPDGRASGDYVVIATLACSNTDPMWFHSAQDLSWYQIRSGRLASWSHTEFVEGCRSVRSLDVAADFESGRTALRDSLTRSVGVEAAEASMPPASGATVAPAAPTSTECPGLPAYTAAVRDAVVAARDTAFRAIEADEITATVEVDEDGGLRVLKLRPNEGGPARQIIQDVKKVSRSKSRPVPPRCALGTSIEVVIPR